MRSCMIERFPGHSRGFTTRRGFSLMELLVVISVVALLASITLPAVQQSREASRRVHCKSNLKNILVAFAAFQAAQGLFPAGGFHEDLLPYLGHPLAAKRCAVYACPSDPESIGEWHYVRQSYLMNAGIEDFNEGFAPMTSDPAYGPEKFPDGLSHTAAVAERLAMPSIFGKRVHWDDYPQWWKRRMRDTAVRHTDVDSFAEECEFRALRPLTGWILRGVYNHVLPPNRNSCINQTTNSDLQAWTASSEHSGGVHVAFGDGTVRFVVNEVDRTVWRGMATRNGREMLNDF